MVYKKKKWEYLKRLFMSPKRKKKVPVADEEVIDDVLLGIIKGNKDMAEKGIKQGF